MKNFGNDRKGRLTPVIIDCISALDTAFAEVFRTALASIELERPVLVEFKRATVSDMRGLAAIAGAIGERRDAGGQAAFLTASSRWRHILRESGVPNESIVTGGDAAGRRRIILAQASRNALAAS